MPFVLDCSMTMAWIFADEASEASDALRDSLIEDYAVVPSLWAIEVANVLLVATRRGRIRELEWSKLLEDIRVLPISVDNETSDQALTSSLHLANRYNLTAYDAVYLELAQRKALPIATLDSKLRAACVAAEVQTLGTKGGTL